MSIFSGEYPLLPFIEKCILGGWVAEKHINLGKLSL